MRVSTVELDKAIEWCKETAIKETKEFLKNDDEDNISDGLWNELWAQLKACQTSLAALQSVKERGGFI